MWAAHLNIKSWFDNWGHDQGNLSFSTKSVDGLVKTFNNKLKWIFNIHETCLKFYRGTGKCSGYPTIVYIGKIYSRLQLIWRKK